MIRQTVIPRATTALLAGALLIGCSAPEPKATDPEQARQVLQTVLEAWKSGASPDTLTSQTPPIRVIDRDWSGNAKILDYQIEGNGQLLGVNLQCPVTLTLQDAKKGGKPVQRRVTYLVSAGDPAVVSRLDVDF